MAPVKKTREYKPTLFDRHGPAAADRIRAYGYGFMVFGLTFGVISLETGWSFTGLLISVAAGIVGGGGGLFIGNLVGKGWHQVMVSGASTPYVEQFSREQALVMQGRVADALASYEAFIAANPARVDARLKAAELYVSSATDVGRAAALLREVQRLPNVSPADDVYASNRLVDLLLGPLQDAGRALVELRRIVDKYPSSRAAEHARSALMKLKSEGTPPVDANRR